jgi:hypothetical protein
MRRALLFEANHVHRHHAWQRHRATNRPAYDVVLHQLAAETAVPLLHPGL